MRSRLHPKRAAGALCSGGINQRPAPTYTHARLHRLTVKSLQSGPRNTHARFASVPTWKFFHIGLFVTFVDSLRSLARFVGVSLWKNSVGCAAYTRATGETRAIV